MITEQQGDYKTAGWLQNRGMISKLINGHCVYNYAQKCDYKCKHSMQYTVDHLTKYPSSWVVNAAMKWKNHIVSIIQTKLKFIWHFLVDLIDWKVKVYCIRKLLQRRKLTVVVLRMFRRNVQFVDRYKRGRVCCKFRVALLNHLKLKNEWIIDLQDLHRNVLFTNKQ